MVLFLYTHTHTHMHIPTDCCTWTTRVAGWLWTWCCRLRSSRTTSTTRDATRSEHCLRRSRWWSRRRRCWTTSRHSSNGYQLQSFILPLYTRPSIIYTPCLNTCDGRHPSAVCELSTDRGLFVWHKPVLCQNGRTDPARFWQIGMP